jgi:hypothetical protein
MELLSRYSYDLLLPSDDIVHDNHIRLWRARRDAPLVGHLKLQFWPVDQGALGLSATRDSCSSRAPDFAYSPPAKFCM